MKGLDTNVVVRYIMQDDARQSPIATRLIDAMSADKPGYVSLVAVVETTWVLGTNYGLKRDQVAQALDMLLQARELVLEAPELVARALRVFKAGTADFADCLIERSGAGAGCAATMTFDKRAARDAGMTLLA